MGKQKRPALIENLIYKAILKNCEVVVGSKGAAFARLLTKDISIGMLTPTQLRYYKAVGKLQAKHPDGVFTATIASYLKMDVTETSANLGYLHTRTTLLECTYEGRNRLWKQT